MTWSRSRRSAALRVRSGIDWFDLEAAIAIDGAPVKLPALLRALRAASEAQAADAALLPA
jgi:hypothetical protein